MSNPQQPELARSRKTPSLEQDAVATVVEGQRGFGSDPPAGPVPVDNQPGHHPAKEQDKPDLDAFAQKLGVVEAPERDNSTPGKFAPGNFAPGDAPGRMIAPAAVAGAVAGVLAAILALLALRRRRARR